jgi:hypothetical protein
LYFDSIYRIVPDGIIPDDDEELAPLLEDGSIGRFINPVDYSKDASEQFLANLPQWSAAALIDAKHDNGTLTKLHRDKTDERVRELFKEAGFDENNHWMHVPTNVASNFMLYLAKRIAEKNSLSLATADWGAWTGASYFSLNGRIDEFLESIGTNGKCAEGIEGFGLFGLILDELVPLNIGEIPASELAEFRRRRQPEIRNFRDCVESLRKELSCIDSIEIRKDVIEDKARQLANASDTYKRSADIIKAKGWFGLSMMGFPAPLVFGQLFSIPHASTVTLAATGLAIGGIYNLASSFEELRKLRESAPTSFLVELGGSFKNYTSQRGGGDINFHAYNCMEEYVND